MKIYEMVFALDKKKDVRAIAAAEKLGDAVNCATESIALKYGKNTQAKLKLYEEYALDSSHAWVFDI